MTAPIAPSALLLLLRATEQTRSAGPKTGEAGDWAALAEASFREVVAEAIVGRTTGSVGEPASLPPEDGASVASPGAGADPGPARVDAQPRAAAVPPNEATVIQREAQRSGVDPSLLVALRRVENGGPGREFGVLAVSAPGLEAQARVAATTIQRSVARYERQGGEAVDRATGRYTEGFIRFLSARYAPIGAGNDPMGLNRFHAENLVALYRKTSQAGDGT